MIYFSLIGARIGVGLNTLIGILIYILIFNIIYSAIYKEVRYLENVLIYTVCMEIQLMIVTRFSSLMMCLMLFGVYFILGLIVIFILRKLYNRYYFSRASFVAISIGVQFGVSLVLSLLLNLFIKIFY